ncbi:MAG TPA: polyphosphate polymerase domain-containing protein [Steroidobacteraceae bacterium]|nr:polyphosphate polymerase domain-containing protein [Steroidobacteraceae bacterium]
MSAFGCEPRATREFVHELKFYVAEDAAAALLQWARSRLAPDPHGGGPQADSYQVSSIYFDTPARDVLARRGSFGRCKYRVRRYGHGRQVFLERKTRGDSRVFKRRAAIDGNALPALLAAQPEPGWNGFWFHRRLLARGLAAVSRVDYQRVARVGQSDYGPMRLTLDQALTAWSVRELTFQDPGEGVGLSRGQWILELKFGEAMPALFKHLVREFAPRLAGISKYRLAGEALGMLPKMSSATLAVASAMAPTAPPATVALEPRVPLSSLAPSY